MFGMPIANETVFGVNVKATPTTMA